MRGLNLIFIFVMFVALLVVTDSTASAKIKLIVNKSVTIDSISKNDLREIFMGKKTRWSNNEKIRFIVLNSGKNHKTFLKNFIRQSPSQFQLYWKRQLFTGKGRLDNVTDSEEHIVEFVANTQGGIGYVSTDTATEGVKIISVK